MYDDDLIFLTLCHGSMFRVEPEPRILVKTPASVHRKNPAPFPHLRDNYMWFFRAARRSSRLFGCSFTRAPPFDSRARSPQKLHPAASRFAQLTGRIVRGDRQRQFKARSARANAHPKARSGRSNERRRRISHPRWKPRSLARARQSSCSSQPSVARVAPQADGFSARRSSTLEGE